MPNPSEADLAAMLANNKSLKLKPEYRLSAPRQGEIATSPRIPPIPVAEPQPVPKASPSANRKSLRKMALAMSEDDLQTSIIELAHFYSWKVAHFRSVQVKKKDGTTFWRTPVAADGEGWPDLVLVKQFGSISVTIFAELKSERGRPSPQQIEWLRLLAGVAGSATFVWRPSDLDEIASLLQGFPDIILACKSRVKSAETLSR